MAGRRFTFNPTHLTSLPNTVRTQHVRRRTINFYQIPDTTLKIAKPDSSLLDLHLVGCISYRPSFGKVNDYQTGIAFEVAQPDPAHPGSLLPTEVGKSVPLEKLRLYSEFDGYGEYAK
jgi:hypothetical protein